MRKYLLIVMAAVICFTGCKKEEAGQVSGESGSLITSLTADLQPQTKVLMLPRFLDESDSEVDRVVWAEGDLITFWELVAIPNIGAAAGATNPGYMPKSNNDKVIFVLTSGARSTNGSFVPQTEGQGLDPDKTYIATHCSAPNRIYFNSSNVTNGDVGTRNILRVTVESTSTMTTASTDLVSGKLIFMAPVVIEEGKIAPLDFKSLTCVMEYQLSQSANLTGNFKVTKLTYSTTPRYLTVVSAAGYNFNASFAPNLRHASAGFGYTLNVSKIELSKDPNNPTVLRYPILTRLDTGTNNFAGGGTFNFKYTLTLEDDDAASVTRSYTTSKTAATGELAFPPGKTFVKTFVVE